MKKTREFSRLIGGLVGLAFFAMAGTANATLISNNCGFSGPGDCTLDTATGTQWLDLTESTGLSFNFVSTQFGAGGQFEGWGYATETEVFTLLSNAGFSNIGSITYIAANFPPYVDFVSLLGETCPLACFSAPFTWGLSGTITAPGFTTGFLVQTNPSDGTGRAPTFPEPTSETNTTTRGSYLIRDAASVPEPASLLLFLLGLASLFAFASSGLSAKQKP